MWFANQAKPSGSSLTSGARRYIDAPHQNPLVDSFYLSFQEAPLRVRFLNDVCLRQMMLATPMMTASPNDVCLTAHCGKHRIIATEGSNIIFAKQMHHIAVGDASFDDIQGYALIYSQKCGIIKQINEATVPYFLSSNSILTKYIKQGKIKSRKAIQTAAIKIGRNLNESSETFLDI